eukprot:1232226-Amphidinium_carterae.2
MLHASASGPGSGGVQVSRGLRRQLARMSRGLHPQAGLPYDGWRLVPTEVADLLDLYKTADASRRPCILAAELRERQLAVAGGIDAHYSHEPWVLVCDQMSRLLSALHSESI